MIINRKKVELYFSFCTFQTLQHLLKIPNELLFLFTGGIAREVLWIRNGGIMYPSILGKRSYDIRDIFINLLIDFKEEYRFFEEKVNLDPDRVYILAYNSINLQHTNFSTNMNTNYYSYSILDSIDYASDRINLILSKDGNIKSWLPLSEYMNSYGRQNTIIQPHKLIYSIHKSQINRSYEFGKDFIRHLVFTQIQELSKESRDEISEDLVLESGFSSYNTILRLLENNLSYGGSNIKEKYLKNLFEMFRISIYNGSNALFRGEFLQTIDWYHNKFQNEVNVKDVHKECFDCFVLWRSLAREINRIHKKKNYNNTGLLKVINIWENVIQAEKRLQHTIELKYV